MHDISSREDVFLLVSTFYGKVRKDELLGPIFHTLIKDWEVHIELLTDFWQTNLFFEKKYFGDPLQKHVQVDKMIGGKINERHFGIWMNLWFETLDELYKGEVAQIAKNRARNMGTYMHLRIFEARNNAVGDR
jgi:hemoglobin